MQELVKRAVKVNFIALYSSVPLFFVQRIVSFLIVKYCLFIIIDYYLFTHTKKTEILDSGHHYDAICLSEFERTRRSEIVCRFVAESAMLRSSITCAL